MTLQVEECATQHLCTNSSCALDARYVVDVERFGVEHFSIRNIIGRTVHKCHNTYVVSIPCFGNGVGVSFRVSVVGPIDAIACDACNGIAINMVVNLLATVELSSLCVHLVFNQFNSKARLIIEGSENLVAFATNGCGELTCGRVVVIFNVYRNKGGC